MKYFTLHHWFYGQLISKNNIFADISISNIKYEPDLEWKKINNQQTTNEQYA